jgi:hypothetical protein
MMIEPINKKYKVTIEFDITLDQVRDYSELDSKEFKRLVTESIEDRRFIKAASDYIANEVLGDHEKDEEAIYFDALDFTVNSYKFIAIEE